jgi:hypothetical protein
VKPSVAELDCGSAVEKALSQIEKEILVMRDTNGHRRQHQADSLPVQELAEGFEDWVRELRSFLQAEELSVTTPYGWQRRGGKTDQRVEAEPQSDGSDAIRHAIGSSRQA